MEGGFHVINETERTPEVFRDHFEECWRHFTNRFNAKYPPGKKGLERIRKPIADFCAVGDQTVARWLSAEKPSTPGGLTDIKLKCFLDLNGYRIIEFERLPRVLRNLSELLGYDVVSVEDAANILGYARPQNIYPVLREDEHWGVGREKEAKMFDLWKERKDDLELKKKEVLKLCHFDLSIQSPAARPTQPLLLPPVSNGKLAARRSGVLTILEGVLALIDEGLFEGLSESELEMLKQSDGGTILQLSARLTVLSSKLMVAEGRK